MTSERINNISRHITISCSISVIPVHNVATKAEDSHSADKADRLVQILLLWP